MTALEAKTASEDAALTAKMNMEQLKLQADAEKHAITDRAKVASEKLKLGVEVAKENARLQGKK